jgi:hypothetical protein
MAITNVEGSDRGLSEGTILEFAWTVRGTTKDHTQDNRYLALDSKREHPEYKCRALPLHRPAQLCLLLDCFLVYLQTSCQLTIYRDTNVVTILRHPGSILRCTLFEPWLFTAYPENVHGFPQSPQANILILLGNRPRQCHSEALLSSHDYLPTSTNLRNSVSNRLRTNNISSWYSVINYEPTA